MVKVDVPSGVTDSPDSVVATVRVVVAPAPVGVILLAPNCPIAPVGSPLTAGVMTPVNPLRAVNVTV